MSQTDSKGHYPNRLDRWLLVRYKKFKTMEDIPETVSSIKMRRVHEKFRIHTTIIIMGVFTVLMFGNSMIGKHNAKHGVNLTSMAIKRQEEYNRTKSADESNK